MTDPKSPKGADEAGEEPDAFDSEAVGMPKNAAPAAPRGSVHTQSVASKAYDLGGKGYLDDVEKMMRDYDKNSDGKLDMVEIRKIVMDLQDQQKQLNDERKTILNMKKVIIFLCVFTVILALAMLGVSFAAAILAKDTSVDPNSNAFQKKADGTGLSTVQANRQSKVNMAKDEDGEGNDAGGRRRLFGSSSSFIGRVMRRRTMQHEEQGRGLFPMFGGSGGRDYSESSDSDDDLNVRNGDLDRDDWDDCSYYEGTVDYDEFERIRDAYEDGDRGVNIYIEGRRGSRYRHYIEIRSGWYDDFEDGFIAIESGQDVDCSGRYNNNNNNNQCYYNPCVTYKPVTIIECDNSDECDMFTCKLGLDDRILDN